MVLGMERYSWPAESSTSTTRRPIIGDMGVPEYGPVRTIRGTVSLIGNTTVRWSMVLFRRVYANCNPLDPQSHRRSIARMDHQSCPDWCIGWCCRRHRVVGWSSAR